MKSSWQTASKWILRIEGGYTNDPDDPGGETNFGISKRSHPNEDIKNLTKERALAIYREVYWDKLRCDDLPVGLDLAMFDMGVHHGTRLAIELLQESINRHCSPKHVRVDGKLGPETMAAVSIFEGGLHKQVILERALFFMKHASTANLKYLRGWSNRLSALDGACDKLVLDAG